MLDKFSTWHFGFSTHTFFGVYWVKRSRIEGSMYMIVRFLEDGKKRGRQRENHIVMGQKLS